MGVKSSSGMASKVTRPYTPATSFSGAMSKFVFTKDLRQTFKNYKGVTAKINNLHKILAFGRNAFQSMQYRFEMCIQRNGGYVEKN